jgi:hypothetical protein
LHCPDIFATNVANINQFMLFAFIEFYLLLFTGAADFPLFPLIPTQSSRQNKTSCAFWLCPPVVFQRAHVLNLSVQLRLSFTPHRSARQMQQDDPETLRRLIRDVSGYDANTHIERCRAEAWNSMWHGC